VTVNFPDETFRPTFSRTMAGVVMGLCGIAALTVISGGLDDILLVWPWLALAAMISWALYWRPRVGVSAGGVEVVNVTRTYDVPWPAIEDIDTKWALTLHTAYGRVRSWAAPAPGRQMMRRLEKGDLTIPGYRPGDAARPSDLTGTESGAAALLVRQRWERLREEGFLDDPRLEFDELPVRWHWDVVLGMPLLFALAIASSFL